MRAKADVSRTTLCGHLADAVSDAQLIISAVTAVSAAEFGGSTNAAGS